MTDFILDLIQSWGYLGIAILMFLENVFPPIPSEVIMGLGGIAVAKGHFDFWTLVAVAVAGTTAGNWIWYGVGRYVYVPLAVILCCVALFMNVAF